MYPVAASGGSRQAPVDIELGGFRIPARTQLVPNHPLLNSPRNWDRPGEFPAGAVGGPRRGVCHHGRLKPRRRSQEGERRPRGGRPCVQPYRVWTP